jgi:hypothetical protein
MERGRRNLLTIAAVALASAIAVNIARGLRDSQREFGVTTSHNQALLDVEPENLNFGDVAANDKFTWEVPVRNASDLPVRIVRFVTSCGCVAIEPESAELAPGESETFRFTLDLLQGWEDAATYQFSEKIQPVIAGATGLGEVWELRGTVHNLFQFDTPDVDFGKTIVVGTAPQPQVVTATPFEEVEYVRCRVVPDYATVDVSRTEDSAFRLRIVPREMESAGDYSFRVLLAPEWAEVGAGASRFGRPVGEVLVAARYEVVEPIEPVEGHDHLGFLRIGQTHEEKCSLRARLGGPVQIERFEPLSSDVEIVSHDALGVPTELFAFAVVCTPKASGEQRATIRFHVTHPDDETAPPTATYDYDFELRYYAMPDDSDGHK